MKFLLSGMKRVVVEHEPTVRTITERAEAPKAGDEIILLVRGTVARFNADEIEVEGLEPVEVVEINRRVAE